MRGGGFQESRQFGEGRGPLAAEHPLGVAVVDDGFLVGRRFRLGPVCVTGHPADFDNGQMPSYILHGCAALDGPSWNLRGQPTGAVACEDWYAPGLLRQHDYSGK